MGHLSACGSKIARKIESAARATSSHRGRKGWVGLHLVYYGSRYYRRPRRGIETPVKWLKNFRAGYRRDRAEREREREKVRGKNPRREIGYPRYFASNAVTCVLHLIKRNGGKTGRRASPHRNTTTTTAPPSAAILFYRVYNPCAPIRVIPRDCVPEGFNPLRLSADESGHGDLYRRSTRVLYSSKHSSSGEAQAT